MKVTLCTNYMCNFCCKRHMHLYSILHGLNNIYRLVIEGSPIDIVIVVVVDDVNKLKTASAYLNQNLTR